MSADQAKKAIRVASVPEDKFEAMVEAEKPPTVTAVANEGTRKQLDPESCFAPLSSAHPLTGSAQGRAARKGDDAASASACIGE